MLVAGWFDFDSRNFPKPENFNEFNSGWNQKGMKEGQMFDDRKHENAACGIIRKFGHKFFF